MTRPSARMLVAPSPDIGLPTDAALPDRPLRRLGRSRPREGEPCMRLSARRSRLCVAGSIVLVRRARRRRQPAGRSRHPACTRHRPRRAGSTGHMTRDVVADDRSTTSSRGWLRHHPAAERRRGGAASPRCDRSRVPVAFHVIRADTHGRRRQRHRAPDHAGRSPCSTTPTAARRAGRTRASSSRSQSIDRTTNPGWFKLNGGKEKKIKAALKVGGPETLNIYSADLGNSLLGWAYFAQDAASDGVLDGVVIHYDRCPAAHGARTTAAATPRPTRSGTG